MARDEGIDAAVVNAAEMSANQARREALFASSAAGAEWSWESEDAAELVEARQDVVRVLGGVQVAWPDAVLVGDAVAQRRLLRALGAYRDARVRQERLAVSGAMRASVPAGGVSRRGIPWWVIALIVAVAVVWFVMGG